MIRLSKRQIILLHDQLVEETGGMSGIRDDGLLESAIAAPFQSFGGEDVYPSIQQKAARLGYGIIKNHCFLDGNKRIGTHAMLIFLELNGIELTYTQVELYQIIISVASGESDDKKLLEWLLNHETWKAKYTKDFSCVID